MNIDLIENNKDGYYIVNSIPDFEFVDPESYYKESFIRSRVVLYSTILKRHKFKALLDNQTINDISLRKANLAWEEFYKKYTNAVIPENLHKILATKKKKEQLKLLKGLSLTSYDLMSFIFNACSNNGYTLSQYRSEHLHKGVNQTDLPTLVEVTNDDINVVGDTSLSDGELKQVVEHRKVTIAKFLDKGNQWHCFFVTYDSLKGKERWQNGQPHLHYISDKFGKSRDEVIRQLKSKKYNLGSLPHINYTQ